MKSLVLLFCLIISLFGCAGPVKTGMYQYHSVAPDTQHQHFQLISFYVDKNFNKTERLALDQAIREWNYALNGYLRIQIISDKIDHEDTKAMRELVRKLSPTGEGVIMLKLNHDDPLLQNMEEEESGIRLAFTNGLGERGHLFVVLGDAIGSKDLHKILLHEIGHLMGSDHVNAPSLMYPAYGYKQMGCIDKLTLAMVAEYRDIDLNHLNYCASPHFE